ncbi:oxidoreductase [Marivirga tractuosa]|uniref:Amine oxidase n=1 Tax=Marivirga tractuosa (strain ATCC 23168 / DSM 4126 / NBRC 15989 / NCIMB 1408 / VKM B-1430 / H-43) TaxID=643867 RepID=E4TPB7_MARTH|nr:NAD(P)/FAD-dependent oxidoreductase [Marivirga tractuosa]ADR20520.1 amine oxidase [Marivirga tractuosa DSM 4126]BDD15032.1 oxidoreductase [Marivirga tractuosa]
MQNEKVIIIGAGIAGLTAAIELEKAGFKPTILEGSDSIGGRVKTDKVAGHLLDHGFQVLLTAYPEAQHYLDYEKLNLKKFSPGALIIDSKNGNYSITDPLRQPISLFTMLFSPVGNFSDKMKIFQWNRALKGISVDNIFKKDEMTSLEFLKKKGFSQSIINQFFKPFFGGIFLENELNTSSRMLEFVFKMFAEGYAAVPEGGMKQIPEMLASNLAQTEIKCNHRVEKVGLKKVSLENGEDLNADVIIVATKPDELLPQLSGQFSNDQFVTNLNFTSDIDPIGKPLIALVPDEHYLINNVSVMNNTSSSYAPEGSYLLSVSVTQNYEENDKQLKKRILKELVEIFPSLENATLEHLKTYYIDNALPVIDDFQNKMKPSQTKIQEGIYLAGDYLLNGSINAAMASGRFAAHAVFEDLKGQGYRN